MASVLDVQFVDSGLTVPAGYSPAKFIADPASATPRRIMAVFPTAGGGSSVLSVVVVEVALAPGAPGNFTVAHGLPAAPALVTIQMDSGGLIWFQPSPRYDATNIYLTASDAGIVGTAQCWFIAASAEVPFTSLEGNFSISHGLFVLPALVMIQMTSSGLVWFQSTPWDSTNVNLASSVAGQTGFLQVWTIIPTPVITNYKRIALSPGSGGDFIVAHGLGAFPFLADISMTSAGEIWFQSTRYDQTNLYLTASDGPLTGYVDVWASAPSSLLADPVTVPHGGTGQTSLAAHKVLVGNGVGAVNVIDPDTSGKVLTSNGASADPTFQAPASAPVSSVFGRTGAVVAASADYTVAQVTNAAAKDSVQNEAYSYGTDSGSTNAYAITLSPVPGSYVAGQKFIVKAASTNTGSATLNVTSLGAKTIKKLDGATNLVSGDIVNGQIFIVEYDGTNMQLVSPVANVSGGGSSIDTYYAGSSSSGSVGSAPTTQTLINACSITTVAKAVAKKFSVSGHVLWDTATHGMRGSLWLDGATAFPTSGPGSWDGFNPIASGDGFYELIWSGIVVSIPGDNATHTVELRWSAQTSTSGFTYRDRWITMVQVA
jgi:hypothetical protein